MSLIYKIYFSDWAFVFKVNKLIDTSNKFLVLNLNNENIKTPIYNLNEYYEELYPSQILGVKKCISSKKVKELQNKYRDTGIRINIYRDTSFNGEMIIYKLNKTSINTGFEFMIFFDNVYFLVSDENGLTKLLSV